jgi:uncharacterized membrane protein YhaH (DUF805 family)
MNLQTAILTCFRKYASFSGRARPSEYWYFVLFLIAAYGIAMLIEAKLLGFKACMAGVDPATCGGIPPFTAAVFFATMLPGAAVAVRRLHDMGRSGWWAGLPPLAWLAPSLLIAFFVADGQNDGIADIAMKASALVAAGLSLWVILMLSTDSNPGANAYGPQPSHP